MFLATLETQWFHGGGSIQVFMSREVNEYHAIYNHVFGATNIMIHNRQDKLLLCNKETPGVSYLSEKIPRDPCVFTNIFFRRIQ